MHRILRSISNETNDATNNLHWIHVVHFLFYCFRGRYLHHHILYYYLYCETFYGVGMWQTPRQSFMLDFGQSLTWKNFLFFKYITKYFSLNFIKQKVQTKANIFPWFLSKTNFFHLTFFFETLAEVQRNMKSKIYTSHKINRERRKKSLPFYNIIIS